jgi:hypothetical protein
MRADSSISAALAAGTTKIPSLAAFEARMVPGHASRVTAQQNTGTAGICWHVQRRSARKFHAHSYYNNSQGRMLREWTIALDKAGFITVFLTADDKCKVSIGLPGCPQTVAMRARKTVAGAKCQCWPESLLAACEFDTIRCFPVCMQAAQDASADRQQVRMIQHSCACCTREREAACSSS